MNLLPPGVYPPLNEEEMNNASLNGSHAEFLVCNVLGKQAIESGIDTLEGLGDKLKCGTNCGSCKSEVSALIDSTKTMTTSTKKPILKKEIIPIKTVEASNV